jgi:hypothetical protein
MNTAVVRKALAGAALLSACVASFAFAQNSGSTDGDTGAQAGRPIGPAEAAGPWTLQSKGGAICAVTLTARSAAVDGTFVATVGPECLEAYAMQSAAAWKPTRDGLAFTAGDGSEVVAFNRWSNSLFVSHRASGADLQLSRGAPPPRP